MSTHINPNAVFLGVGIALVAYDFAGVAAAGGSLIGLAFVSAMMTQ